MSFIFTCLNTGASWLWFKNREWWDGCQFAWEITRTHNFSLRSFYLSRLIRFFRWWIWMTSFAVAMGSIPIFPLDTIAWEVGYNGRNQGMILYVNVYLCYSVMYDLMYVNVITQIALTHPPSSRQYCSGMDGGQRTKGMNMAFPKTASFILGVSMNATTALNTTPPSP